MMIEGGRSDDELLLRRGGDEATVWPVRVASVAW